jgi:hypothetical protein
MDVKSREEGAMKDLSLIQDVFKRFNKRFFIAYGTCLGAYRDKDFLPGDDDIDLGVVDAITFEERKGIGWMLYDLGFKPQDIMFRVFNRMEPSEPGYNGDAETGIIVCERNVKITLFFFKEIDCPKHGKEMICIPKLGAPILIGSPAKFYKKLKKIKFKGMEFLVPSPTDEYLDWTYEDWKDPMKRDHGKLYNETHSKEQMLENIRGSLRIVSKTSSGQ